VVISDQADKTEQRENQRREAFHILFPIDKLDSLRISQIIIFDLKSQKSYASLAAKTSRILEQNRFMDRSGIIEEKRFKDKKQLKAEQSASSSNNN
jgi:hypothetical protein